MIETERARLARIAARLRQMEQEDTIPPYDVLLKHVDPLRVVSVRARLPIISERAPLSATLSACLDRYGVRPAGPELLLLHSRHEVRDDEMSIDVEVALPVPPSLALPADERVRLRTLPGGLAEVDRTDDPDFFVRFLDASRAQVIAAAERNPAHFLAYLDVHEGHHVLDAGCGVGDISRLLAQLVGPTGRVVGVDNSATMVRQAQQRGAGGAFHRP